MSQQRVFLLFTTGIVGVVFLGCVILGVTIYINLPAWLPPQATTSSGPSNSGNVTRPAQAPWHLELPPMGPATQPATLTHEPAMTSQAASTASLPTHTLAPLTLPANAVLPTQPTQAVATPIPVKSPTRTPGLPTIAAIPAGSPRPSTPTATASTARPTASSTSTLTTQATYTPTRTATPSPSPTVGQSGGGGIRGEAGGMAVTAMSVRRLQDGELFYLVVDVIIENVNRNEQVPYDSQYFGLQDSGSNWYYEAPEFAPEPGLTAGLLARGQSARGNIAFEITSEAQGFVLTYDVTSPSGDYEVIQLDLGQ